jgi:Ala-tRNA(Pro) deacylase
MAGKQYLEWLRESSLFAPDRLSNAATEDSMPLNRLKDFLDTYQIKYSGISHSVAYTAQGIAALTHISGKELAKTVVVKADNIFFMTVVPASRRVDLAQIKSALAAKSVELASEEELRELFPDCETGAMPPFGNLYGIRVLADESLTQDREIVFNAGSHRELIRMAWADYVKLAKPTILCLTVESLVAA